jgi:hypothetical protein
MEKFSVRTLSIKVFLSFLALLMVVVVFWEIGKIGQSVFEFLGLIPPRGFIGTVMDGIDFSFYLLYLLMFLFIISFTICYLLFDIVRPWLVKKAGNLFENIKALV